MSQIHCYAGNLGRDDEQLARIAKASTARAEGRRVRVDGFWTGTVAADGRVWPCGTPGRVTGNGREVAHVLGFTLLACPLVSG